MKHTTHRQTRHTHRQNRRGGRGVHTTAIIWCKHPFQKKIKNFKNEKNKKFSFIKIYKEK